MKLVLPIDILIDKILELDNIAEGYSQDFSKAFTCSQREEAETKFKNITATTEVLISLIEDNLGSAGIDLLNAKRVHKPELHEEQKELVCDHDEHCFFHSNFLFRL